MKTRIGVPDYEYDGGFRIAVIRGQRKPLPLNLVSVGRMEAMRTEFPYMRGIPTTIAVDLKRKKLWLFPTPGAELEIDIDEGEDAPAPKQSIVGTITKSMLKHDAR